MAKIWDHGHLFFNHIYKTSVEKATNTVLLSFWIYIFCNWIYKMAMLTKVLWSIFWFLKYIFKLYKFQNTYFHQVYLFRLLVYLPNYSHFGTKMIAKYIDKIQKKILHISVKNSLGNFLFDLWVCGIKSYMPEKYVRLIMIFYLIIFFWNIEKNATFGNWQM